MGFGTARRRAGRRELGRDIERGGAAAAATTTTTRICVQQMFIRGFSVDVIDVPLDQFEFERTFDGKKLGNRKGCPRSGGGVRESSRRFKTRVDRRNASERNS